MEMVELLRKRRSIRKFTGQAIDPGTVELLVESLLRAPSSRGIDPWEFVLVDDRELLGQLSKAKEHGSTFLKDAPLGIVVCADSTKSDVWVEDCAIASILVQMTALSLGLGSCWIQVRNRNHGGGKSAEEHVQDLLGLPRHIKVESMVAIGYPDEAKRGISSKKLQFGKVKFNHY